MNPWAFLIILVGILLVIVGVKGTQHNIASAVTGRGGKSVDTSGSQIPAGGGGSPKLTRNT